MHEDNEKGQEFELDLSEEDLDKDEVIEITPESSPTRASQTCLAFTRFGQ